jgi:dTDP-4-amino-4,6-dideoxygalactose transaminase
MAAICSIARHYAIPVVEDCAQAQGATIEGKTVGGLGEAGCFSFYPTKNLGALGDGGLVATNDPMLANRVKTLRTYGWTRPQYAELPGGRCSRLDELQAAILLVKLERLESSLEFRRRVADRYRQAFSDLPLRTPCERPGASHTFQHFVIRCDNRDGLATHLHEKGIQTGLHYPYPAHVQPGFAGRLRIPFPVPVTEAIWRQLLSLPIFPSISDDQQMAVIDAVRSFHWQPS